MSLRNRLRAIARQVLRIPAVKKSLRNSRVIDRFHPGWAWERVHPIDEAYGIETSGFLSAEEVCADPKVSSMISGYGPVQPSTLRESLKTLGEVDEYTFLDLGCGKGRALVVASEFPFRKVLGVELSSELVVIARKNAEIVLRRFPDRPKIEVVEANVLDYEYPEGKTVVYLFYSFGAEMLSAVVRALEERLAKGGSHMFFVSHNPVDGFLLDDSPAFRRYYTGEFACEASDINFGPYKSEVVTIWESVANAKAPAAVSAGAVG